MALTGDYIGFTFNGKTAAELGIIRTSTSNSYKSDFLPTMQDKTVQVPGSDGTYYFGSFYTQRKFSINFATDELTETQFRQLRQWLGDREIHDLIFEELPYKVWSAKITGTPNFDYMSFATSVTSGPLYGGDTSTRYESGRVYKGTGTIEFTMFYPFARSNSKYIYATTTDTEYDPDHVYYTKNTAGEFEKFTGTTFASDPSYYYNSNYEGYNNVADWQTSANILNEKGNYDAAAAATITLRNGGDMDTYLKAYYAVDSSGAISLSSITLNQDGTQVGIMSFAFPTLSTDNSYICVNGRSNLIEGCDTNKKPNGNIYNRYITAGAFFTLPTGEDCTLVSNGASCAAVEYDYLYF